MPLSVRGIDRELRRRLDAAGRRDLAARAVDHVGLTDDGSTVYVHIFMRPAWRHFRPGDVILRQGEIGDQFYIIESGEVEILREEPGKADQRLGIRSAGTSFGEIALLKGVPRTATVRCLTSVDVIMLARHNFLDLIRTHKVIRAALEQEVLELFIHGLLHLLGFDHETKKEAALMKKYEIYFGSMIFASPSSANRRKFKS